MKRHESLAPLSREHHQALILARLIQKTAPAYKELPVTPEDKVIYAVNTYNTDLREHFRKEEEVLEKVKHIHPEIDRLTAEIISEHRQLTEAFITLHDKEDPVEAMDQLGAALEAHIRKEERVLFPLIQENCPEELLRTIVL